MKKNEYNSCLDFIKGIACILVVLIHCRFPGTLGLAIPAISRFCVPFFFMVSGYFCFRPLFASTIPNVSGNVNGGAKWASLWRKIRHVGKITFYASLFYIVYLILRSLFVPIDFSFSINQILDWIIFNSPVIIAGQYWFLFALLYAYIFYGILEKLGLRKFSYLLAAILFVVYICLAQGAHITGTNIYKLFYRNWLVEAFPYFMLGHWIHENQDKIRMSNRMLLTTIVVTTLLCWVERWTMGREFGVNVASIPQVFAIFVYGVKNPMRHKSVMQRLGRDCSMLVYILHPIMWHSFDDVYLYSGASENVIALYIKPLLVVLASIAGALFFNWLVEEHKGTTICCKNILKN